ncbi:Uncharacterized protein SAMN04515620_1735 [Collimonas sp. OK607]|uniref:WD40/YVTN/BNR-like repeat-containing protein n=1 Tax=Collimonas sp. OK607 TaxID=1798194 RepID=UPI0008E41D52|nr:YCF48-related protein [Collimonas sp. OK607]SFB41362.1 Uncharacterized protein SAMN04515620_1735 [Collimonas sp. OK607]
MTGIYLRIYIEKIVRFAVLALLGASIFFSPTVSGEPVFKDPLDHAAEMSLAVVGRPMMAVAKAGARLVAVGSRGLIITSDDNGVSWAQSRVPVQSDLLAVQFPTASQGWAVGHDGVILHSADGGTTWEKQLDGRLANDLYKSFYRKIVDSGDPAVKRALDQLVLNFKAGPALPYLDVWFSDPQHGFAVGSFGMIAATVDGGKTWEPWLHRIENDQFLNLNAIRGIGGNIYIVGEHGMVFTLDEKSGRFNGSATGYAGSFFGIAGSAGVLVSFGLRGNVYRSRDDGKSWESVKMPSDATVMGGAVRPDKSGFVLVNSAGQLMAGDAEARDFRSIHPTKSMRYTNIAFVNDLSMVLTGLGGVRVETLPASAK